MLGYPYSYGAELSEEDARKNFRESMSFLLPVVLTFIICNSKVNAYDGDISNNAQKIQIERVELPPPMLEIKPFPPMVVTIGPAIRIPGADTIPLSAIPFALEAQIPPLLPLVKPGEQAITPMVEHVVPAAYYAPTLMEKVSNLHPAYFVAGLIIAKAFLDGNILGGSINAVIYLYILYRKLK